ncbi:MAG: site-2 protease family protein, partial [Muribaculaceae bacterium]|nr:site-2 protease family protein [Muribaculaceae bacterium]
CKISGMIDESMDTEQMKQPAKPYEFRSKPAWQRLLVMIAGVLFNFLLAIIIYAGIVYATGEKYVSLNDARLGLDYSPAAQKAGFQNGDLPIRADGESLDGIPTEDRLKMMQAKEVTVLRDGKEVTLDMPENFIFDLDKEMKDGNAAINFFTYRIPTRITQVMPGEGAAKAGVQSGDEVIAINETATPSLSEFLSTLQGHDNETVSLTVVRKGAAAANDTVTLPVQLSENSKMGVGLEVDPSAFFNVKEKKYNLFTSIPRGIEMGVDRLTSYAKSMKLVFTKEGAKSVGGFGAIGSIFPESWDWIAFWNIAAFLSVALAFMNILPIPALDGGHVLFLLYEVVFRRKPSEKFMEYAQMTGMVLLIALLIYANGMDIVRFFFK